MGAICGQNILGGAYGHTPGLSAAVVEARTAKMADIKTTDIMFLEKYIILMSVERNF